VGEGEAVIVFGLLLGWALVAGRVARLPITAPMVFIGAGVVLGPQALDVLHLDLDQSGVLILAEVTLSIVLFSDAARIDVAHLRREVALPARMLGIGLPLTIGLGTFVFLVLLPDLSWREAGLLAAILAPTDAALGQAVVSNPVVPERIRQSLNVESGLNDGLAVPAFTVFLTLAAASEERRNAGEWVEFVARQIGFGALFGVGVGVLAAWLILRSTRAGWSEGISGQLAGLAVPGMAVALAATVDGNGFIAAFTAGLAFKFVGGDETERLTEYAEDTGQLLALVSFVAFGNVLVGPVLDDLTWRVAVAAVLSLTLLRMVPVAVSLVGAGLRRPTIVFLGWFGPRGLASILLSLTVLEERSVALAEDLFAVVAWTVLASVVAHGMSAAWAAERYGRWYRDERDAAPAMEESMPVPRSRVRGEPHPD
jgi:sodium/hydrogen antiporter